MCFLIEFIRKRRERKSTLISWRMSRWRRSDFSMFFITGRDIHVLIAAKRSSERISIAILTSVRRVALRRLCVIAASEIVLRQLQSFLKINMCTSTVIYVLVLARKSMEELSMSLTWEKKGDGHLELKRNMCQK